MGFVDGDADDARQESFLIALLHHRGNVEKAAAAAGVPRSTAYRWLKKPKFAAEYRAARRQALDEAMASLQLNAVDAVNALKAEFGEKATGSQTRIAAAKAFLSAMFKAGDEITVHEELENVKAILDDIKAHDCRKTAALVVEIQERRGANMVSTEISEAICLRMAWMREIGHDAADIEASVRFNRPQSVAEEREMLELVRAMMEQETAVGGAVAAA